MQSLTIPFRITHPNYLKVNLHGTIILSTSLGVWYQFISYSDCVGCDVEPWQVSFILGDIRCIRLYRHIATWNVVPMEYLPWLFWTVNGDTGSRCIIVLDIELIFQFQHQRFYFRISCSFNGIVQLFSFVERYGKGCMFITSTIHQRITQTVWDLLWFLWVTLLIMWQSYDCPSVSYRLNELEIN